MRKNHYYRNPHLTRSLGFDGLKIMEKAWDGWDYYPDDIGVDWDKCFNVWERRPPETVIIYNIALIKDFKQIEIPGEETLCTFFLRICTKIQAYPGSNFDFHSLFRLEINPPTCNLIQGFQD